MKILKFSIKEDYYQQFKLSCDQNDITIKKKLNVLLAQDVQPPNIHAYMPSDLYDHVKVVTLKVNEELYKGVMKKCGKYELKPSQYINFLIMKHLNS